MRPDGWLSDQRNSGAVPGAVPAGDRAGQALAFLGLSGLRPADHGSGGLAAPPADGCLDPLHAQLLLGIFAHEVCVEPPRTVQPVH